MEKVNLYFILKYKKTGEEIQMPVLSLCEEYSCIAFSTMPSAYGGKYDGIGRLPSYPGDDTTKDYDVFVVINGVTYKYDGLFYVK